MEVLIYLVTVLLSQFDAGVGGEFCFKAFMETEYCAFGCCDTDSGFYEECCSSTGPIIGICIGLSILLSIIFVICSCKLHATHGRVVSHQTNGHHVNTRRVGNQQPVVSQQKPGQQTYVHPPVRVGYPPVPPSPPSAQIGYPYPQQTAPVSQMGYQQHPLAVSYGFPDQQMPVSPTNRPFDMQTTQGYPVQHMPTSPTNRPFDMQTTQRPLPSAPPPSYEQIMKEPK